MGTEEEEGLHVLFLSSPLTSLRPLGLEERFKENNSSNAGGLRQGSLRKSAPFVSLGEKRIQLRGVFQESKDVGHGAGAHVTAQERLREFPYSAWRREE